GSGIWPVPGISRGAGLRWRRPGGWHYNTATRAGPLHTRLCADLQEESASMRLTPFALAVIVAATVTSPLRAQPDAERGKAALLTRAFTPAGWKVDAYANAWKHWSGNPAARPEPYAQAFMDHYGL